MEILLIHLQVVTLHSDCSVHNITDVVLLLYVQPIFLNEVMLRKLPDDDPDGTIFHLSHIEHLYSLRAPSTAERFVVRLVHCL